MGSLARSCSVVSLVIPVFVRRHGVMSLVAPMFGGRKFCVIGYACV